jgi:hypothetical protein
MRLLGFLSLFALTVRAASFPAHVQPPHASAASVTLTGWYASQLFDFSVIVDPTDSTRLLIYCTGMAAPVETGTQSIGLFRAPVSNPTSWTEVGQVLIADQTYENGAIRCGSVVYDSGTYYLFYTTGTSSTCLATSTNGTTFAKYSGNPILSPSGDETQAFHPAVIKEPGGWSMVYTYSTASNILAGFRAATSTNATAWTKTGGGDLLTTAPLYGEFHQLLKYDGHYYLIYESGSPTDTYRIFAADSSSATGRFSPMPINPLLKESGTVGAFDRYHVATPCLVLVNNLWLLFYCGAQDHAQPYGTNHWPPAVTIFVDRVAVFGSAR